jgi:hypothetical protein
MRRTKHVIAVMVVATALCADRSLSAAPAPRGEVSEGLARSFASKLTSNLRRAVAPTVSVEPARSNETVRPFALPIREEASGIRSELSPFQFRLPPPQS